MEFPGVQLQVRVTEDFIYDTFSVWVYSSVAGSPDIRRIYYPDTRSSNVVVQHMYGWDHVDVPIMEHAPLEPSFRIRRDFARLLATGLFTAGVRPAEQSNIEGRYDAQSEHLEDMRDQNKKMLDALIHALQQPMPEVVRIEERR